MNFSLSTPIERQAALAAITAYIEVLDGVRIQPIDNPAAGMGPLQTMVHNAITSITEPPVVASQVFGGVTTGIATTGEAFGMVTTPMPQFPVPTIEQREAATVPEVPAAPVADPNLDVNGVAYNAEIHSTTRTKNKDCSWRLKRNTGGAEVPPAPPVVAAPPAPAPVAPPAPVATTSDTAPTTFKELMDRLAPLMQSGKVNFQAVSSACQLNGVAALPALNANVGAIPAVWATLQGMM